MSDQIDKQFQNIRMLYFPKWTDGSNWRIVKYSGNGNCNRNSMTIQVGSPTANYSRPVSIIHEIAHAVTIDDHGDEWVQRMREAAVRAVDLGDEQLADELQRHIAWVIGPNTYDVSENEVNDRIREVASEAPDASFEKVIDFVARDYGQDSETFLRNFPKARDNYDIAHIAD